MRPLIRVGLLFRPGHNEAEELSGRLERVLREHGARVWRGPANDGGELAEVASELDVVVTLGGDGTIVRALHSVACRGVPILGVNLGRLGFLAEVEPRDALALVPKVVAGEYSVEERMMLHTELRRGGETIASAEAINDVVLGRGRGIRSVQIALDVDGHHVMTQTADGIIVSSPTGSTAYCLSAGGPILAPGLKCLALTPIAAHLAVARSIVVPSDVCTRLTLVKGRDATFTVDGRLDAEVCVGDEVLATESQMTARFVRFGSRGHYYETVLRKLRWPDQADRTADGWTARGRE